MRSTCVHVPCFSRDGHWFGLEGDNQEGFYCQGGQGLTLGEVRGEESVGLGHWRLLQSARGGSGSTSTNKHS